jgi:hypothetical protein
MHSKGKVQMYKPGSRPTDAIKTEVAEENMVTDQQSAASF